MRNMIAALDRVASELETAGYPQMAKQVDTVSNTLNKDLPVTHPDVFRIPTELALSMTGFDRKGVDAAMTGDEWESLRDDIRKNGIRDALRIEPTPDGKSVFLASGNHRVHIAQELGMSTVPVYVGDSSGVCPSPRHTLPRDQIASFVSGQMNLTAPSLPFQMDTQKDDVSCGPTCLAALYDYHGMDVPHDQVLREVEEMPNGGTIAVLIGLDAIKRGMASKVYICDLNTFDPTWKTLDNDGLAAKLLEQLQSREVDQKFEAATRAYVRYLLAGGEISFEEVTKELLEVQFLRGLPIIAGLSSTWLYQSMREFTGRNDMSVMDDMKGGPMGHFVVVHGFDEAGGIQVADPSSSNPFSDNPHYSIGYNKFLQALMLGSLTYDASLLVLSPQ